MLLAANQFRIMLIVRAGWMVRSSLGRYVASLCAAWCLIDVALYLGFVGLAGQRVLPIPARLTLGAILVLIPFTEALLLSFAMSGLKNLWRADRPLAKVLAAILIAIVITVTATLLAAVITSWLFRAHWATFFPKPSVVRALLAHLASVIPSMTFNEIVGLAFAFAVGILLAAGLFQIAPEPPATEFRRLSVLTAVNCLILGLLVRAVPPLFELRERNRIEALVRADFLPTSTLIWAPLMLPDRADMTVDEALYPRLGTPPLGHGEKRPNIILISVESLRGGEESRVSDQIYVMPTVHRLATEGIHFTRAYAPSNESAYSLSAILTSQHMLKTPARDDFRKPAVPYVRMYDLLPETYTAGFFSADSEEWQNMGAVSQSPKLDRFFDASRATAGALEISDADTGVRDAARRGELHGAYLDDEYPVRAFEQWFDHLGASTGGLKSSRPFFAVLKFEASHFPYQQGFNVPIRFSPADLSPAESRSLSFFSYPPQLAPRLKRRYWNSLSYDDGLIQRVLEHLRNRKALDNTVVMVFGDHGELFYENGATTHADRLWEQTLHTSFVVWGAKNWAPLEYMEPVSLLDIAPMVLDLAGVAPHGGFQGQVPAGLDPGGSAVKVKPRPIFSVAQNVRFEESVLVGRWRYSLQSDDLYESLHDVERDPFEIHDEVKSQPEIAACLYTTLMEFRRNQLGYYHRSDLVQSYFPPRHRLANIPSCAALGDEGSQ